MRNVIDDIDTRDVLLLEQEHRLAFLLAEDGNQHVGASYFPFARALYVEHRTLKNALKTQRRLCFALLIVLGDQWRGGVDELL